MTISPANSNVKSKNKSRFPAFDCPFCGAKNILFAVDRQMKNDSELIRYEDIAEHMHIDCVTICPKCKKRLALRNRKYIRVKFLNIVVT